MVRDWLLRETQACVLLRIQVAETLKREARGIGERWEAQAQSVALRNSGEAATAGCESAAVALVESLAAALASDGTTSEGTVARGLAFGASAFKGGASLHHMLKGLNLLTAMTLYAVETAVAENSGGKFALADVVRLCRQMQHGSSFLILTAAKGYTQAASDEMRRRFRHLRHDLKNPLGTIKSVLALMDDETIPPDARSNPRFRAMAKRNARLLGELIAERLSEAEAVLPTHPFQIVSLRTVVYAVRRDLRAKAIARGTTVLVAGTKVRVQLDAVGLELILHELLHAALQESAEGDELSVDFDEVANDRVTARLQRIPTRPLISERGVLDRLNALTVQMGGKLDVGEQLVLSYPVQHVPPALSRRVPVVATADVPPRSNGGDSCYNVRSTGEREHGQPGSF